VPLRQPVIVCEALLEDIDDWSEVEDVLPDVVL
jgi:hypothetical protein